jgi:hypothetical protein
MPVRKIVLYFGGFFGMTCRPVRPNHNRGPNGSPALPFEGPLPRHRAPILPVSSGFSSRAGSRPKLRVRAADRAGGCVRTQPGSGQAGLTVDCPSIRRGQRLVGNKGPELLFNEFDLS